MKLLAIMGCCLLLAACVTTYPQKPEDQASYYVDAARGALEKNDVISFVSHINSALERPTGNPKVAALFAEAPRAKELFISKLEASITGVTGTSTANHTLERLKTAKSSSLFPQGTIEELIDKLNESMAERTRSGQLVFDLSDRVHLSQFPAMLTPEQKRLMLEQTIKRLQENRSGFRPIEALMAYVAQVGVNSSEGQQIGTLLDTLNIRRSELVDVERIFPAYVQKRKASMTAHVLLQVKNADRLFVDDLKSALQDKLKGIEWVREPGLGVITLVIERARNDERVIPERTETVTYATHQVGIFDAALFMPRGASYLFEQISGGAEIEYGYVVSALVDGKTIHDEVIRGKVGGEYRRCQNARIQNVFGGVNPAAFIANTDMQSRCSGSGAVSLDELRKQVLSAITNGVMRVRPIQDVHDMNG